MKPLTDEEIDTIFGARPSMMERLKDQAHEANRLRDLVRRLIDNLKPGTDVKLRFDTIKEAETALSGVNP